MEIRLVGIHSPIGMGYPWLIRGVCEDLKVPKMPFVIGVLGVDGEMTQGSY